MRKSVQHIFMHISEDFLCASSGNCVTMQNVLLRVEAITNHNNNLNLYHVYILIDFHSSVIIFWTT